MADVLAGTATEPAAWVGEHELGEGVAEKVGKFADVPALAKGYVELQNQQSNALNLPKDDAADDVKAEQMGKVWDRLGRPKTPADYVIKEPTDLPEGLVWDRDKMASFCEFAHAKGCSQQFMSDLVEYDTARQSQQRKDLIAAIDADTTKRRDDAETALKVKWGQSNYDTKIKGVNQAIEKYDTEGKAMAAMVEAKINTHPAIVEMFDKIYEGKMAEGVLVPGAGPSGEAPKKGLVYDKSPEMKRDK